MLKTHIFSKAKLSAVFNFSCMKLVRMTCCLPENTNNLPEKVKCYNTELSWGANRDIGETDRLIKDKISSKELAIAENALQL